MQNKGFVKVFALLLTLVCVFYLSFSFVTRYQMNKVEEITQTQGEEAGARYLDSVMNNPVWLGAYSLKDCREMEISLGLDLKGGMNVILEVSVPDVVKALADHKTDPAFNKAVEQAVKESKNSQSDFITLFIKCNKHNLNYIPYYPSYSQIYTCVHTTHTRVATYYSPPTPACAVRIAYKT